MFAETFGSCILIFMYLVQTDEKTRVAKDPAVAMLIISASYVCAMSLARYGSISPLNPAVAAGLLGANIITEPFVFHWGFVLCIFPFLGGMLGLVVFELLYKKTAAAVKPDEDGDKEGGGYKGGPVYNDNPYADQDEPLI